MEHVGTVLFYMTVLLLICTLTTVLWNILCSNGLSLPPRVKKSHRFSSYQEH